MQSSLYDRIPLKNTSPEAMDLLRTRIVVYTVPKQLIPRALGFEKKSKENQEKKESK